MCQFDILAQQLTGCKWKISKMIKKNNTLVYSTLRWGGFLSNYIQWVYRTVNTSVSVWQFDFAIYSSKIETIRSKRSINTHSHTLANHLKEVSLTSAAHQFSYREVFCFSVEDNHILQYIPIWFYSISGIL